MLLWRVWYVRNEVIHAKPAPPIDVSVRFLSSYLDKLSSIRANLNADLFKGKMAVNHCFPLLQDVCVNRMVGSIGWLPPSHGRVKLNTDGSVLNGVAGTGMVLHEHLGNIIFCACRHVELCEDALESEILAIREGINLALQWSTLPIDIESDCLEAVTVEER